MKKYFWIALNGLLIFLVFTRSKAYFETKSNLNVTTQTSHRDLQLITLPDVEITLDQIVASGFNLPVQVTNAGDGTNRLFVVEQTGKIRIIQNDTVLGTPFIDLTGLIICCGERGLLSLAFHPEYALNGYFFVYYTRAGDGASVIARYQVSADPNVANPSSEIILKIIAQPYSNHNGGQLFFGPDGFLYIGMGDGGSGGDPLNSGQDINALLGAMLRIDVDGSTPYEIPADNPFVGTAGLDEIWAIGLRNPWRFSFDSQTGDLYIGDVGQNLWEEISYQAAGTPGGTNFGWRCKEGTHNYNFSGDCFSAVLTDPIAEYSHSEGNSVTGGFVYRGSAYPDLVGRYFYADYVEGKVWSIYKTGTNPDTWSAPELELDTGINISGFGEGENRELYVVDYGGGTIRRLADVKGPVPELSTSQKQVSTTSANPAEIVSYTIWLTNTRNLSDNPVNLTDTIPAGLVYVPGTLQSSHGVTDDSSAPTLTWAGNLNASQVMTISYQVQVTGLITGSIVNQALVSSPLSDSISLAQSISVPRSVLTTTVQDFFFPGTQPGGFIDEIRTTIDCDTCHNEPIYDRWRGSMMSQSGRDPLMWAALQVANIDAPNAGEYCLRCHTPKGWYQGRSHPADGSALQTEDINSGVACALCHRAVDPVPSSTDEAVQLDQAIRTALTDPVPQDFIGSGALIVDPNDNRRGPFSFNTSLAYHSAYQTDFLSQVGEAITQSRLCGSCHNVYNPVLSWDNDQDQYWPNQMDTPAPDFSRDLLFPIETTFDEWLYSDFADSGVYAPEFAGNKPDGIVRTCQDCHMSRGVGYAADLAFTPIYRDCETTGCLPEHNLVGGNAWVPELLQNPIWRLSAENESAFLNSTILQAESMLRKAATLTVTLTTSDTVKIVAVRVINRTGHKLPTGYPEGRQMWINLQAFDVYDQLIYESGAYNLLTGQLNRDVDVKVYEAKQGITPKLASVLGLSPGESFHFVLNNTVIKDNRIPPQGYNQDLFDQPGLRPVGVTYLDGQYWDDTIYSLPIETARVFATLYYQTSSLEYIDFLQTNGGVDGLTIGQLWAESMSPPRIVAQAWSPNYEFFFPYIAK
jgi:uncharacterized repeat protein (TIGR01451 family)